MIRILMTETEPYATAVRRGELFTRYRVTLVPDGEAVLAELERDVFDAVFIGMILPKGSGRSLTMAIRDLPCTVPVVLLSSLLDEENEKKAYAAGVNAYFFMPCSPALLEKRTEALFLNLGLLDPAELSNGELVLKTDCYQAFLRDRLLVLTATEYELLRLFMKNKARIMTREELLELVWGSEYDGDPRVVDAHVKNLRRKLPEGMIVTHRGIGYRMPDFENHQFL